MSKIFVILTLACLIWYSTITVYVAIKGVFDIKSMLSHLGRIKDENQKSAG